ncbi:hypothetical protein BN1013_02353 [Candidatus Rubidus massiliensis]|nr:hypothetical protein BN1013_02353 [Candidatus Rubidus massiliensis]
MEFSSGISLAAIEELDQKEHTKKKLGILSAAFIGVFLLVLGFLAFSQSTRTNSTSSQIIQKSHCGCGSNCSCGMTCSCH